VLELEGVGLVTILAQTSEYLVEYESGMLTIARYSDGHCLAFTGKRVAGEFRDCLRTHPPERVVATYIRIARGATWQPLYKPECMPREEVQA
jgi:hypothetical protein